MTQSVATAFTEQWIEGQVAQTSPIVDATLSNEDSSISKITNVQIKGTDPERQGKKPLQAFTFLDFMGIIIHAQGIVEKQLLTGVIEIPTGTAFTVIREGFIVVRANVNIIFDEPVFFIYAAGINQFKYSNVVGSGITAASKIPALYKGSVSAGELVKIYVNFAMKIGTS